MHQHQSTRNYETKDGFPGILRSPVIAVLTLERHQKGIWISKLMEALSKLCEQEFEYQGNLVKVQPTLYTLESFQMSNFAEADVALMDWLCFVNRVSDAASPTEVKVRLSDAKLKRCMSHSFGSFFSICLRYFYQGLSSRSFCSTNLEYSSI